MQFGFFTVCGGDGMFESGSDHKLMDVVNALLDMGFDFAVVFVYCCVQVSEFY